jgi:hypothetical protein
MNRRARQPVRPPIGLVATATDVAAGDAPLARFRREVARAPHHSKREWTKGLRELAAQVFVSDREQRPVAWHARQLADLVSPKTVEVWSARDRWLDRRAAFLEKVRAAVLNEIGVAYAAEYIDDLRQLDALYGRLAGALLAGERGAPTVPPTFTSRAEAMRCLLALDQRRDEKRRALGQLVRPPAEPPPALEEPALIPARVARAMAHARLRAERDAVERDGEPG